MSDFAKDIETVERLGSGGSLYREALAPRRQGGAMSDSVGVLRSCSATMRSAASPHPIADAIDAVLARLEQAERERDEAKALAMDEAHAHANEFYYRKAGIEDVMRMAARLEQAERERDRKQATLERVTRLGDDALDRASEAEARAEEYHRSLVEAMKVIHEEQARVGRLRVALENLIVLAEWQRKQVGVDMGMPNSGAIQAARAALSEEVK